MFPSFLLSKLFRSKNIATSNPPTFLHNRGPLLRRISSNTSSAAEASSLDNPSAQLSASSKRCISSNTSCAAEKSSLVNLSAEVSASSKRLEKSTLTRQELNRDYTVSYLVESCGLSHKDALSASEKVHFATPEIPNSVLDLLSNHGFTSTQISNTVRRCPGLLVMDAEKIIFPKLEFFQSIGVSKVVLAQILSYSPILLRRSLKNQIEPACNIIKSFVQSDKKLCTAIKRSTWLLHTDRDKSLVPNIAMLQEIGVPNPSISLLLTHHPHLLMQNPEKLSAYASKVKEMGFNPSKWVFIQALNAISGKGKKLIWDRCYKIYSTKWGWSEEDILSAFKKKPHCMILSEKKLNSSMEFLVNTMGWPSKCIAQHPTVLTYSLEKRIIPRCSVIRVLWRKGLVSKYLSPRSILDPMERDFLKRYVTKYEQQVPQLVSIYKGKMDALVLSRNKATGSS